MSMKIGGLETPPVQPEAVGEAARAGKAAPAAGGPALTLEAAQAGGQQAAGGPLGMEDLLPTPDYGAQQRVLFGAGPSALGQTVGATPTTSTGPSQDSNLTMKIDPNTASSNAAVAAMMDAGAAMIQAQQESGKAEDTERKSDLEGYEAHMDSAVQDLRDAASNTWSAALTEGLTGIAGAVFSIAGPGLGAGLSEESSSMTRFLASSGENPGGLSLAGNIIGSAGKIGGAGFTQEATNKEADQKTDEKFAGVFQSATQNAAQYRDTFFQTQTQVIAALQQVVQGEGAAEQSAASGRA
jgi:hypothetical protein